MACLLCAHSIHLGGLKVNLRWFRGAQAVAEVIPTHDDFASRISRPSRRHLNRRLGFHPAQEWFIVSIPTCAFRYPLTLDALACFGRSLRASLRLMQIPCARPLIDRLFYNTAVFVTCSESLIPH